MNKEINKVQSKINRLEKELAEARSLRNNLIHTQKAKSYLRELERLAAINNEVDCLIDSGMKCTKIAEKVGLSYGNILQRKRRLLRRKEWEGSQKDKVNGLPGEMSCRLANILNNAECDTPGKVLSAFLEGRLSRKYTPNYGDVTEQELMLWLNINMGMGMDELIPGQAKKVEKKRQSERVSLADLIRANLKSPQDKNNSPLR